jgi:hypothetical protein
VSKGPSDTQRLLRAFKVPPTNKKASIILGGGFAVISALGGAFAIVPAAALAAGLGIFEITDRRAIRKGLTELDVWGIPVEGYREWLLADEPAFDIELRHVADAQVISTSARAVDPGLRVRRIGEREVRFVTRQVALPGLKDGEPPVYIGDRRLLFELWDRILAPLHSDVGIARIRMGERTVLEARPSEPVAEGDEPPVVEGMGAFRDQAMAAPPALQALVHTGSTLALAADTRSLRYRNERILFATGRTPHGVGSVLGITLGVGLMGLMYGPIGWIIAGSAGLITGTSVVVANNRRNAYRADSELFADFPVEDYDAWLLSGRPLFDIELRREADRASLAMRLRTIEAFSSELQTSVKWVEDITWIDDNVVRVETRPTLITPASSRLRPFYGGSHLLFKQLVRDVLVPINRELGIVAVRMGGYTNRRV